MLHIIKGKVIKGDGYGRKLGFPTVNLDSETAPKALSGVYTGKAMLEGVEYKAGIVIGSHNKGENKIEAHLIGYNGDAYGKEVTLEINKFIREFKKFETEAELITQIKKDIEICSQE